MLYRFIKLLGVLLFRFSLAALPLATVAAMSIEHGSIHLKEYILHSTPMSKVDKLSFKLQKCLITTKYITSDLASEKTLTSICPQVKATISNAYGGTVNFISRTLSSLGSMSLNLYYLILEKSEFRTPSSA